MAVTSVEFGARQRPVADAVREMKTAWIGLLEGELRVGRKDTAKSRAAVAAAAFALDAFTAVQALGPGLGTRVHHGAHGR